MIFTLKHFLAILTLAATALLWGCGSSGGGGDDPVAPPRVIAFTGSGGCIACHEDYAFSADIVAKYLTSKHLVHGTGISAASGADCLACHDPVGEGPTLGAFVPAENLPGGGLAVVGCENCHGPGGDHYGLGPIPVRHPGVDACGKCHKALPVGPAGHLGQADNLVARYRTSKHASSLKGGGSDLCTRCHSDEGFRAFTALTTGMDADQLTANLSAAPSTTVFSAIQCRTCHDSHSGELRSAASGDVAAGSAVPPFSQGFNLCTSCHQVFLTATYDALTGRYNYLLDDTRRPYHGQAGAPLVDLIGWVIWDSHFSSPLDGVAGYGIDASRDDACTVCHDPHAANRP